VQFVKAIGSESILGRWRQGMGIGKRFETQPDVSYRLKEIACQSCRQHGVSLDFRAVLSVRESVYFVTCASCQLKFPEQSYLESFE
jgi:hypothetical protein